MKYFFLSANWKVARVWEFGGLWNETVWQRKAQIQRLKLGIVENRETLWLYQVEDAVLMVEVKPDGALTDSNSIIGQVVLKRLMDSDQVFELLTKAEKIINQP